MPAFLSPRPASYLPYRNTRDDGAPFISVSSRQNACPIRRASRILTAVFAPLLLAGPAVAAVREEGVDYLTQVRPILARSCFACHGQDEEQRPRDCGSTSWSSPRRSRRDGTIAIVPGDPDASEMVARIVGGGRLAQDAPQEGEGTPLRGGGRPDRRWIAQGRPMPSTGPSSRPRNTAPLDQGETAPGRGTGSTPGLDRLEREGLAPSPEADRFTLLRRVSLDLRGLPPTPREIDAFAADTSPDAYERAVDRFLADPAFGERRARIWLDLARYADSAGYGSDPLRPNIWRYRDWVIDALNRNLPYDRFTVEPGGRRPASRAHRRSWVATAFHRNTMTNTEGGTDDGEFRVAAIKDRVDTTSRSGWD